MEKEINQPIGALWLIDYFKLKIFLPLAVSSGIASRRFTEIEKSTGYRVNLYPEQQRPKIDTTKFSVPLVAKHKTATPQILWDIIAHLQFHLRHEIPHFEFLSRLFEVLDEQIIQHWVDSEPTGQYARRAAFLYEFFTGKSLISPKKIGGNYVDVINEKQLVAASREYVEKNTKWRVNNNLPGNRNFCPMVLKTEAVLQASSLEIKPLLQQLDNDVGQDTVLRSAAWFTLGESKASFLIEGESDKTDKIQRFAHVMARFTGKMDLPLQLGTLQKEILGSHTVIKNFGCRQSPVFIGINHHFQDLVQYIAPPYTTVREKLEGISEFWQKTSGQSAVMRTAVVAFAFVYVHPLADGNGRVHRFLMNDLLRREGETDDPIILPISGLITENSTEKSRYYQVLNEISAVVMQCLEGQYSFTYEQKLYPDGIRSNFVVQNEELAEPIWQYPNLTTHVNYFADVVQKTITVYMKQEVAYLQQHDRARMALKAIVDMPNHYADRIIRSMLDNKGQLSQKLKKEYEFLAQEGVWEEMVAAVQAVFR